VVADERDVIGLRTNYRGEQVHLYPLRTPVERARKILLDYVKSFDELSRRPAFYNALTQNCTTTIRMHVQQIGVAMPWDWRLLVNGYLDQMLYERKAIVTNLSLPELEQRSLINAQAQGADRSPDFSARIREKLG
jgi:hypothetical protein